MAQGWLWVVKFTFGRAGGLGCDAMAHGWLWVVKFTRGGRAAGRCGREARQALSADTCSRRV